jgi:hypothetical protein
MGVATTDQAIEVIRARIDEHGRILTDHGEQIKGLLLVVQGDDEKHVKGLLERSADHDEQIRQIQQWRREMAIYARIVVGLLGATGVGVWRDVLQGILKSLGG